MPASKFNPQHETYLPVSIFYQTITGEYVAYDTIRAVSETDLVLTPDMTTATAAADRHPPLATR